MRFSTEQVTALCGGTLPKCDYSWEGVDHFLLEDNMLRPCSGGGILPGRGIIVATRVKDDGLRRPCPPGSDNPANEGPLFFND